jgi:nucleoside-diphosphate-sugar epimerase
MQAPAEQIKIRSYNLAAMSFTPTEIAAEIKTHSKFTITYEPDQKIADSWPASIDDHQAREDWGWKHEFDLESMTVDMLEHLVVFLNITSKKV